MNMEIIKDSVVEDEYPESLPLVLEEERVLIVVDRRSEEEPKTC